MECCSGTHDDQSFSGLFSTHVSRFGLPCEYPTTPIFWQFFDHGHVRVRRMPYSKGWSVYSAPGIVFYLQELLKMSGEFPKNPATTGRNC